MVTVAVTSTASLTLRRSSNCSSEHGVEQVDAWIVELNIKQELGWNEHHMGGMNMQTSSAVDMTSRTGVRGLRKELVTVVPGTEAKSTVVHSMLHTNKHTTRKTHR